MIKLICFLLAFFAFTVSVDAANLYCSSAATGGEALTFADPGTLQAAADTAVAGDSVFILNDGTFVQTVTLDFDTNAGGLSDSIIFRGVNSTTTSTAEVSTISGSGLGANDVLVLISVNFLQFENVRFTAATDHNIDQNVSGTTTFRNCRMDGATDHGVFQTNSAGVVNLHNCQIDTNGVGLGSTAASRGTAFISGCSIHDNTGNGLDLFSSGGIRPGSCVKDSLIYDNGGDGISEEGGALVLVSCTITTNTGDGLQIPATLGDGFISIEDTILDSNGGFGINTQTGSMRSFGWLVNVGVFGNSSGAIDINSGVVPGAVTTDPQFVSTVDGSEDFEVGNTDYTISKVFPKGGTTEEQIGAIQTPAAAGGGGMQIINGGGIR